MPICTATATTLGSFPVAWSGLSWRPHSTGDITMLLRRCHNAHFRLSAKSNVPCSLTLSLKAARNMTRNTGRTKHIATVRKFQDQQKWLHLWLIHANKLISAYSPERWGSRNSCTTFINWFAFRSSTIIAQIRNRAFAALNRFLAVTGKFCRDRNSLRFWLMWTSF